MAIGHAGLDVRFTAGEFRLLYKKKSTDISDVVNVMQQPQAALGTGVQPLAVVCMAPSLCAAKDSLLVFRSQHFLRRGGKLRPGRHSL